jgi:carbonic anhydrase
MKKFFIILLFFICSCSKKWSYEEKTAPEFWGDLDEKYKFCKIGYNQSPIDVISNFTESDLSFDYKKAGAEKEKKEHNLVVNFHEKNYISRGKKKYFLRNFLFRHPSEHLISGTPHSLEMQIAHKSEDEQWLILAVFFELGKENNNLDDLVKFLTSKNKETDIDLSKIIKADDKVFFYDGSFTTPPCKEGVKWHVMETPIKISKDQMNKIIKSSIFVKSNARPVQDFNPEKY